MSGQWSIDEFGTEQTSLDTVVFPAQFLSSDDVVQHTIDLVVAGGLPSVVCEDPVCTQVVYLFDSFPYL